jgi:hypothetical protein
MPYLDDLIAQPITPEVFIERLPPLNRLSPEVANKMFPGVELNDTKNVFYFPFRLCHSLPAVNGRGRTFTPRVLANSFASLNDQLIDYEHSLEANGTGYHRDRIIGHVKATQFELPAWYKDTEIASIKEPFAVHGLAALFLRASGVAQAIDNHVKGKEQWDMSMECGHRWSEATFLYRNEFIPAKDAEVGMKDCVEPMTIRDYKGHPLAACLGGLTGSVDFWGVGFTRDPADKAAKADITYYLGSNNQEAASKKVFFMPLQEFSLKELELASLTVDKKLNELATISIIGETEPAEDGHKHDILSNLTILPAKSSQGSSHTHHFSDYNVGRGTNPVLTGVTDAYHESVAVTESNLSSGNLLYQATVHSHLVQLGLRGKYKSSTGDGSTSPIEVEEADMNKLQELLEKLDASVASLTAAKTDEERRKHEADIVKQRSEIASLQSKETTEEEKKIFLQEQLKTGKVLTKEQADEAQANAIKVALEAKDKEHQAALKSQEVKAKRLQLCNENKIDLDTIYDGIKAADGSELTFRKRLESLPTDEQGEQQFKMDFLLWKTLFEQPPPGASETPAVPAPAQAAAAAAAATQPPATQPAATTEAASKKPAPRRLALAGAGGGTSSEAANTGASAKAIPAHLQGRRSLKSLAKE